MSHSNNINDEGPEDCPAESTTKFSLHDPISAGAASITMMASFDVLMQTDEDEENVWQEDAKDEIEQLMDHLCKITEGGNITWIPITDDDGPLLLFNVDHLTSQDEGHSQIGINTNTVSPPNIELEGISQDNEGQSQIGINSSVSEIELKGISIDRYVQTSECDPNEWESERRELESAIKKMFDELTEKNELLASKNIQMQSLKAELEDKESKLQGTQKEASNSMRKCLELQQKLEDQQLEIELIQMEKEQAITQVAKLTKELKLQLSKCQDLESQCVLNTTELEILRKDKTSASSKSEVQSKKSKVASKKENSTPSVYLSGLNYPFSPGDNTGPYNKCDVDDYEDNGEQNVFPGHQRNFNFYNEASSSISSIKTTRVKRPHKEEPEDEDEENSTHEILRRNTPFLRVGLSKKSRIRRPLHEFN